MLGARAGGPVNLTLVLRDLGSWSSSSNTTDLFRSNCNSRFVSVDSNLVRGDRPFLTQPNEQ